MARDYEAEYQRREELAHERGYDSFYDEREARSFAYEMGADRSNVEDMAAWLHDYSEGDADLETWKEAYAEWFDLDVDDFDDWAEDFYAYMQEYYDTH